MFWNLSKRVDEVQMYITEVQDFNCVLLQMTLNFLSLQRKVEEMQKLSQCLPNRRLNYVLNQCKMNH